MEAEGEDELGLREVEPHLAADILVVPARNQDLQDKEMEVLEPAENESVGMVFARYQKTGNLAGSDDEDVDCLDRYRCHSNNSSTEDKQRNSQEIQGWLNSSRCRQRKWR